MKVTEMIPEAAEVIIDALNDVLGNPIFPQGCADNEYFPEWRSEDSTIWIPTKYRTDGKKIFVTAKLDLELEP